MAYQKQAGYVGLGQVIASAVPISDFEVDRPAHSIAGAAGFRLWPRSQQFRRV